MIRKLRKLGKDKDIKEISGKIMKLKNFREVSERSAPRNKKRDISYARQVVPKLGGGGRPIGKDKNTNLLTFSVTDCSKKDPQTGKAQFDTSGMLLSGVGKAIPSIQ